MYIVMYKICDNDVDVIKIATIEHSQSHPKTDEKRNRKSEYERMREKNNHNGKAKIMY